MVDEDPKIRLVKDALQALIKAKKNLRLYPPNNPMYVKTVEDAYKQFAACLDFLGELRLKIGRNEIFLGDEIIYQGAGKEENLALFFFRDGLREMAFNKGLDAEEFYGFLEIISFDFEREDVEDDLVTLLWQRDFKNIKYTVDENVLTEDEGYEKDASALAKERAAEDDDLQKAYADALEAEEKKDVPVIPLTDRDFEALDEYVEKQAEDKAGKLTNILFEMMVQATNMNEFKDVVHVLNSTVDFCLRSGRIDIPVGIFERVRSAISSLPAADERRKQLNLVLWYASSPEAVKTMCALLDSEVRVDGASFTKYVGFLDKAAIPTFVSSLGDLKTEGARKDVINGLAVLSRNDPSFLGKGLVDPRWQVVCDIIHVLKTMGDKKAVEYLVKACGHGDVRVKKEALKSLGEVGGQQATLTVKEYLEHQDQAVRFIALRALGNIGTDYAKNAILWKMSEKNFIDYEFGEKKEYFDVLSRWKDAAVVDFLMKTLKKGSLFKRAKYNELKACAAYCLGLIGSRDSLPELEKMRDSRDEILSEYAYAAIKRIEYDK